METAGPHQLSLLPCPPPSASSSSWAQPVSNATCRLQGAIQRSCAGALKPGPGGPPSWAQGQRSVGYRDDPQPGWASAFPRAHGCPVAGSTHRSWATGIKRPSEHGASAPGTGGRPHTALSTLCAERDCLHSRPMSRPLRRRPGDVPHHRPGPSPQASTPGGPPAWALRRPG